MADTITPRRLGIAATIQEGVSIGTRNIGPILANILLYILTVWVPYINVGTTIGLTAGIVCKASRGEPIPMTEIFNPQYRKYMGEFFLTGGLIGIGVAIGLVFCIIPGIVIACAWSLAIPLVVDKGKNPTEAITLSNNCTYGSKAIMFGVYAVTGLLWLIVLSTANSIAVAVDSEAVALVTSFIIILVIILGLFVCIGLQASIYKQLTADV